MTYLEVMAEGSRLSIAREAAEIRSVGGSLPMSRAFPTAVPGAVTRFGRSLAIRFPPQELASFGAIGVICTLLFVLAYHFARNWLPPLAANSLALTSTAGLNFAANRWLTFRGRSGALLIQASQYFVSYVLGLGASSLALSSFLMLWDQPSRSVELTAALLSSGLATAIRYVAMTLWVFRKETDGTKRQHIRASISRS